MIRFLKIVLRNVDFIVYGKGIGFIDKVRLKLTSRYKNISISFFNKKIKLTDASSFVSTYEEIFMRSIYAFKSATSQPLIIDCGANIGLSVIFLKKLFPESRIIAFEPDAEIFKVLNDNINSFSLKNIDLQQKAVWKANDDLYFQLQGGLSGSLVIDNAKENIVKVKAFRLKEILNQPVDFLKIDIEGAEYDVIKDCREELRNVKHLFIEYHSFLEKKQTLDEILAIVSEAGFRYHIHEASSISPVPFMKINSVQDMDLQLNIFAYRAGE